MTVPIDLALTEISPAPIAELIIILHRTDSCSDM